MVPFSVILFVVILIVKVCCHQLFDFRRKHSARKFNSMNEIDDDDADDEKAIDSIVSVYLRALEVVEYRNFGDQDIVPHELRYMMLQKKC